MPRRSVEISETTIRDQNGILEVKIQLAKVPENGQVADNNDDDEIEAISKDDIRGGEKTSKTVEFKIQDFTDIASYNWLDRPDPTILVPGIPPVWSPPGPYVSPPPLRPDAGPRYVDQNGDRYPWFPLEPMIIAVATVQPGFAFAEIDVITDRRPLRKLFDFVKANFGSGGVSDASARTSALTTIPEDFQFGVEVVGSTVLFVRKEFATRDHIPPGTFQGYRRAFEEAYTNLKPAAKGSTSHHRVMRYRFAGLRFLVRSSFDAYLENLVPKTTGGGPRPDVVNDSTTWAEKEVPKVEDLVPYLAATSLSAPAPSVKDQPDPPDITVVQAFPHKDRWNHDVEETEEMATDEIPHQALVELKTRFKFAKSNFDIASRLPDMWLAQTPNFIIALHQNVNTRWVREKYSRPRLAEFVDLDILDMRTKVRQWEEDNAEVLEKLGRILRRIVDISRQMGGQCWIRSCKGQKELLITKSAAADEERKTENRNEREGGKPGETIPRLSQGLRLIWPSNSSSS